MGERGALSRWRQQVEQPLRERVQEAVTRTRARAEDLSGRLMRYRAVQVVVRTVQETGEDNVAHMAAGIAYYALFSLFPLLLGLLALFSFFWDQQEVRTQLNAFLAEYIPSPGVRSLVSETLNATLRLRGTLGALSIVGLFWAASAVFGAISRSVNRAWNVEKDRPFYLAKARHLGMALGVGVLFLLSMSIASLIEVARQATFPGVGRIELLQSWAVNLALGLLPLLFSFLIFLMVYKFVPNTTTSWRYVIPGALVTALLFEAVKRGFILYLSVFANYEQTYGSGVLRDVVVFLFWVYLSSFILLLGAEFTAELGNVMEGRPRGNHRRAPPP